MLKRIPQEDWTTLLISWALIMISGFTMLQADLMDGLEVLLLLGSGGLLLGFLLAKSNFLDNTAHIMALVYGIFFTTLIAALFLEGDFGWRERVMQLSDRQILWFNKAVNGGSSRDGLIFLMHTSLVFWLLGYLTSWFTFHTKRIWWALLPGAFVILSVVYYAPPTYLIYLAAYTLVSLLYISQTYLSDEQKRWKRTAVRYAPNIKVDFWRSSLIIGLLALLFAWAVPAPASNQSVNQAVNSVNSPWRSMQNTWTRLFASLQLQGVESSDAFRNNLLLGGPRVVGDSLIMDVYVNEKLPVVYWKAINYDTYVDGNWEISNGSVSVDYLPDQDLIRTPNDSARTLILQKIVNYRPNTSFIYGAPEVVSSDQQMMVRFKDDGNGRQLVDSLQSRFLLRQGETYQISSRISTATADQLRVASTNYPDWVVERYLQVPDSITPRTLDLAANLAAGKETNFDKAIAIRDYLRRTITYNDQIDAPPSNEEPIDYILFELQEGYCNYYSSAMAIMLRSLGIPARVAAGYVQGDFDADNNFYRVRAENAHSWVEVYFPEYGWIQFEPTASINPVDRADTADNSDGGGGDGFDSANSDGSSEVDREGLLPEDDPAAAGEDDRPLPEDAGSDNGDGTFAANGRFSWLFTAGAILLVGLAIIASFAGIQWNSKIESDLNKSYSRLGSWAQRLGLSSNAVQTPYERAHELSEAVPEGRQAIRKLTHQFILRQFSEEGNADPDFDPRQEWRTLRPLFLRKIGQNLLDKIRRKNQTD